MISKKTKYILIALTIVGIMITGTAYAVNFASEYDTNNPVSQDNEWNQYKWQAEGADVLQNGAVVTWPPNQLYDANHAVLMPPGSTVQYYLYLPGVQNSTIDVKWGIYRLFLFADTTNNDTQSSVNIHVYIDYDFIQIVKRITSPAAPGPGAPRSGGSGDDHPRPWSPPRSEGSGDSQPRPPSEREI